MIHCMEAPCIKIYYIKIDYLCLIRICPLKVSKHNITVSIYYPFRGENKPHAKKYKTGNKNMKIKTLPLS